MPINPIKEQRKISNKYVIGYYSHSKEFQNILESTLNSSEINFELINLNVDDTDLLNLYLSCIDEAIFEQKIPENLTKTLSNLKLFIRITCLKDINFLSNSITERANLILELKKEKNFDQEKNLKFIMQIVSILENKDPYTKDHSARVAKYSMAIAEPFFNEQYDKLFCSTKKQEPEQYEKLKHEYVIRNLNLTMISAWAHDIGKNNIAQTLLNKNSKLTKDEYDMIKMHADFGANMIRKILGNEEFANIIENHHERIDGHGYHNLTDFPDISKILAISDSFDAMTTTRSYTTKLQENTKKSQLKTVEEAINELQVASHSHFDLDENRMSQQLDTELTNIFVKLLKKDLELIKNGQIEKTSLLSSGLDENGFLKAGFWNDKTQEYSKDPSVYGSYPKFYNS